MRMIRREGRIKMKYKLHRGDAEARRNLVNPERSEGAL